MNEFASIGRRRKPSFQAPPVATPRYIGDVTPQEREAANCNHTVDDATAMNSATSLLPDLVKYTHTVPQASLLMKDAGCKYFSERKVQRLCSDNKIDCYKLKTSRNGQPVSEYLINGSYLLEYVTDHEVMRDDSGNARLKLTTPELTPFQVDVANSKIDPAKHVEDTCDDNENDHSVMATPQHFGVASQVEIETNIIEDKRDDIPPPDLIDEDDGNGEFQQSVEVQELIEKAELRAKYEGEIERRKYAEKLVEDVRENEKVLQHELVKLTSKTLDTMQNIALRGILDQSPGQGEKPTPNNPQLL